ncbi:protein grainyhead-like [Oppia nitens]|uniref:protein grainyhead-like n=1 Tax=Oppia nitens TaxID=1686743 RepID=UPI0023DB5236|nr:protein grainyhead-like [Oppia nitens]
MLNISESTEESPQTNGSVQGLHQRNDYYKLPVVVDGSTKGIALITTDTKVDGSLQEMVWSAVPVTAVNTAELVANATIVTANSSPNGSSSAQQSDEEHHLGHSSPINGNISPLRQQQHTPPEKTRQLIVSSSGAIMTNGDSTPQTIIVTSGDTNHNNNNINHHNNNNNTILHTNDVNIKSEPLDPLPPVASPVQMVDVIATGGVDRNRELEPSPPATVISLAPAQPYQPGTTQLTFAAPAYDITGTGQYTVQVNTGVSPQYATVTPATNAMSNGGTVYLTTTDYITYRDYYPTTSTTTSVNNSDQYQTVRQHLSTTPTATYTTAADTETTSFLDRYLRQQPVTTTSSNGNATYKATIHGLTVDLPSPDSGIGDTTITPRQENGTLPQVSQIFDYTELSQAQAIQIPVGSPINQSQSSTVSNTSTVSTPAVITKGSGGRRSWHEYGRNSEIDKIQIPKIHSDVGFKYYLESPISTSQRREDDRVTYINKGQFYGISLEYIPDNDKPLKSATVKSLIMLVFREEKLHDEEIKAWQFWHSRQHSVKQRIMDADTKNSAGIVGPIEEITHNAIAFYWNPLEGPAKVNVAVQCLSTDFSNQKGVKGLPLHLQIDTFDDFREGSTPVHRAYCQIKVFCDKGAERKTRDEERRAAKRKLSATGNGRKKMEEMYHPTCERSEFYSMSDLMKPPVLFTPSDDIEKVITTADINFYGGHNSNDMSSTDYETDSQLPSIAAPTIATITANIAQAGYDSERVERTVDPLSASLEMAITCPPKKIKLERYPNTSERVLLYAKQENEEIFHPLHLVPPSLVGLALAIENKYKLEAKNIRNIYKRCKKGITVQMDDDMVKHYSHEDTVLLEVHQIDEETHDITLVEFDIN